MQSSKGVGKQSNPPKTTHPEECTPRKSNQSAVQGQQQRSQHQDVPSSPHQIYAFIMYSIHRVNGEPEDQKYTS